MITVAVPDMSVDEMKDVLEKRCKTRSDPPMEIGSEIIEAVLPAEVVKVIEDCRVHGTSTFQFHELRFM